MSAITFPVRYAVARSGESWPESTLAGVEVDPAGEIRLLRLPGLAKPSISPPADLGISGLALDDECGLYVADTAGSQILRIGLDCATQMVVPGARTVTTGNATLKSPRGMCVGAHEWLFVANGDGQILTFTTPDLTLRGAWGGLLAPTAMACHSDRVLVVDAGAKRVLRFDAFGNPDSAFNAAMVPPSAPTDPVAVCIGGDGTIYLGDAAAGGVWRFDWSGGSGGALLAAGTQPRALAVAGSMLLVGDVVSGQVLLFALPSGTLLGGIGGFVGPVTALATERSRIFIKTGVDGSYEVASMGSWYAPSGTLTFGPIDAGEDDRWRQAAAKCTAGDQTSVGLEYYTDVTSKPTVVKWVAAPSLNLLIPGQRFLWLRVTLNTRISSASPVLLQLGARTAGDSYLDYLPYVYTHNPDRPGFTKTVVDSEDPAQFEPGDLYYLRTLYSRSPIEEDFLGRLLELARSQLGELELEIADLHTLCDPATAPADLLTWLSSWMAFDVPARLRDGQHPDELRQVLLRLADLYMHRSTRRGVGDFVELYAQVRPHVFEEFSARPMWVLDHTGLGFGTGLPDRDLEGILVGDSVVGETGPQDPNVLGAAAFMSTAHRFTVTVPPSARLDDRARGVIAAVVEAEKPAHTVAHVCFLKPRLTVGMQARVGLDAFVALEPPPIALDESAVLGMDTRLAGVQPESAGAVGRHSQLGIDTRLG